MELKGRRSWRWRGGGLLVLGEVAAGGGDGGWRFSQACSSPVESDLIGWPHGFVAAAQSHAGDRERRHKALNVGGWDWMDAGVVGRAA